MSTLTRHVGIKAKRDKDETAADRLDARLPLLRPFDGCWEWQGHRDRQGYGELRFEGKQVRAHRVAWMLHHASYVPAGLIVCHACDNPPCCNPRHLFLGTHADNARDSVQKGRRAVKAGARSSSAKLTDADVAVIRDLRGQVSYKELAERFGVHPYHIHKIWRGEHWKDDS